MKLKRFKRMLAWFVIFAIMAGITMIPSSGHNQDIFTGSIAYDRANIKVYIAANAKVGNVLTMARYRELLTVGRGWNGISSKVKITSVEEGIGNIYTAINVFGHTYPSISMTFGETVPIDSNGNIINTLTGLNGNWSYIYIFMNDDANLWTRGGVSTAIVEQRVVKVITHEIGHALKLRHPSDAGASAWNPISEHNIPAEGNNHSLLLPQALMNQGFPDEDLNGAVRPACSNHDRSNLIAKWGA
jgi:hypothetical protein